MAAKKDALGRGHGSRADVAGAPDKHSGISAAGYAERYVVAQIGPDRAIERRLSGIIPTIAEAADKLRWIRRRYPGAVIVRELRFLEVLG